MHRQGPEHSAHTVLGKCIEMARESLELEHREIHETVSISALSHQAVTKMWPMRVDKKPGVGWGRWWVRLLLGKHEV